MQQAADDVGSSETFVSPDHVVILDFLQAQASFQGIQLRHDLHVDGSRHSDPSHESITLCVMFITREPRHGSSKAVSTRIGNQQLLNRFSGFMENVRTSPTPA